MPDQAAVPTPERHPLHIASLGLLALLTAVLFGPTALWTLNAWISSPSDHQGPVLAALALAAAWQLRGRSPRPIPWVANLLTFGAVVAAWVAQAAGTPMLGTFGPPLLLMALLRPGPRFWRQTVWVGGLALLALPNAPLMLGQVLQNLNAGYLSTGVVVIWPLAGALLLGALYPRRVGSFWIMLLAAWPVARLCQGIAHVMGSGVMFGMIEGVPALFSLLVTAAMLAWLGRGRR